MSQFKDQWNLEMALEVLQSQTVDSKVWADAAKWLMLYGPPEIQEIIGQASNMATHAHFPNIVPKSFNGDGQPCYDIRDIAKALDVSEEEALAELARIEDEDGIQILVENKQSRKIQ